MTKHLRFLFVMLLTMIWSAGWAQTTIDFTKVTWNGGYTQAPFSFKGDIGGNTNIGPTQNFNTKDIRLYAKNKLTVSTTGKKIVKIVFTISTAGKKQWAELTATTGSVVADIANSIATWENVEGATSVTFTVGDKCKYGTAAQTKPGQFFFNSVDIYELSAEPGKTPTKVAFPAEYSNKTFTFTEGKLEGFTAPKATETNNVAGTITYSSNNESAVKVNASTGALSFPGYGEATITATFTPTDTETYAVSTDSYKVKNERGVVAGTITFDKANGAFDVLNANNVGYGTAKYDFVSDTNESYTFDCKDVMKTSANNGCLQIKKNTGKVASPAFPKFTNGYKVNIIYSSKKALQLSAGDANVVIGTTTSSNKTNGLGASVSISVPANVPFVITSGGSEVTYVSKIEIIPNKIDETETLTLNETATNTIEAKTGVNVTLKRSMVKNEWNTICLPFDVTEKQAKAAFGDEVKIAELDTEAAVDANVLSFKASTGIVAATPYLIKPSAVADEYTFENVDITNKAAAYSTTANVDVAFKGIYKWWI